MRGITSPVLRAFPLATAFFPTCSQDALGTFDRLGGQQDIDSEAFKHHRETAAFLGPRKLDVLHAMRRAVHSRRPSKQHGSELTRIQVSPSSLAGVVVARTLGVT